MHAVIVDRIQISSLCSISLCFLPSYSHFVFVSFLPSVLEERASGARREPIRYGQSPPRRPPPHVSNTAPMLIMCATPYPIELTGATDQYFKRKFRAQSSIHSLCRTAMACAGGGVCDITSLITAQEQVISHRDLSTWTAIFPVSNQGTVKDYLKGFLF